MGGGINLGDIQDKFQDEYRNRAYNSLIAWIYASASKEQKKILHAVYVLAEQFGRETSSMEFRSKLKNLAKAYLPEFNQRRVASEPMVTDFSKYAQDWYYLEEAYIENLIEKYQLLINKEERSEEIEEILLDKESVNQSIVPETDFQEKTHEDLLIEYFRSKKSLMELTKIIFDDIDQIREKSPIERDEEIDLKDVEYIIEDIKKLLSIDNDPLFPEEALKEFIIIEDQKELFYQEQERNRVIAQQKADAKKAKEATLTIEFPE